MKTVKTTKADLFWEIEQLPPSYLPELQNFVRYLKFKQLSGVSPDAQKTLKPEDDPILGAIGLVDAEPFSEVIDDILYAERV